ncbi:hypothetical protein TrLO_g8245 [Triparma laevis f. longispina]|uniref:Helicase C-terminal domain-containing protein n=1 Tax=Triparma laevis f. longispina TaxID=1714387 RepID=A0A9W7CKJ9_9STRA|nr:hypothetical protein TrLO_g8245 [Triparma laevis f. longispina]
MQYTTSPQDINRFMGGVEGGVERLRILFSAYQSAREISEAGLKRMFSGSILDKAHETAATGGKQMAMPLFEEHVPTRRRILMTGTPRLFVSRSRLLKDAAQKFGMKKVVAFSRTNARAKSLQEELVKRGSYFSDVIRVYGVMSAMKREAIYSRLLQPVGEDESIVVCNSKVMVTGFDLPDCDGVFLADWMESHAKILQAVARAARKW